MLLHNKVVPSDIASDEEPFLMVGIVYEGTKVVYFRGGQRRFTAGDLFCLGYGCCRIEHHPSKYYPYKESVIAFSLEELKQSKDLFNDYLTNNTLRKSVRDVGFVDGCRADAAILGIFNALRSSSRTPSFAKRQGMLRILSEYTDGMVLRVALTNLDSRHLLFNSIVRNNRFQNRSIDELAEQCHCSRSSFKEMFHKHYDSAPYHYFLEQRLEKAQSLLAATSYSISEISSKCGFNSPSHFARIFRLRFSMSPREYRCRQQFEKLL